MARYEIHRTDSNAKRLIEYLEAHGASVEKIDRPLDLAVGFLRSTALVEIKTAKGKLRKAQQDFLGRFRGLTWVIRDEADCDELLKVMRNTL